MIKNIFEYDGKWHKMDKDGNCVKFTMKDLNELISQAKEEERERVKNKIAELYNKFEKNIPPASFDKGENNWNNGFYKGQLKAMEKITQEILGINGDELKQLKDKELE